MVWDSQITRSPSIRVGTFAVGLSLRYASVSVLPNWRPRVSNDRFAARHTSSPAARLVRNGVHFDLGIDDCSCLDGGAGQHGILEVLSEYPVVASEVAGIPEIGRDAHDIGQGAPSSARIRRIASIVPRVSSSIVP